MCEKNGMYGFSAGATAMPYNVNIALVLYYTTA